MKMIGHTMKTKPKKWGMKTEYLQQHDNIKTIEAICFTFPQFHFLKNTTTKYHLNPISIFSDVFHI